MTVQELIAELQTYPAEAEVRIKNFHDPLLIEMTKLMDSHQYYPITTQGHTVVEQGVIRSQTVTVWIAHK